MAQTIKITDKQAAALIWAINVFESTSDGLDEEDELAQDYAAAMKLLAPIYDQL